MNSPLYPSLYQINTRVWLTELARELGRPATLDDIPDAELDCLAEMGFDWIWLLSVWQTGPASRQVSCSNLEWRKEFQTTLRQRSRIPRLVPGHVSLADCRVLMDERILTRGRKVPT